jgi:CheY-like chemotaxis protein
MTLSDESASILVVEDEIIVSGLIADILTDSGLKVAGPFRSNRDCLDFLDHDRPDAAVLDFNIADGTSGPIAQRLQDMGVPFIVASAYPREIASGPVASALRSLVQRGQVRAAVYSYPIWFWFPRFMLQAFCCGEFLQLRQVSSGHYLDLKKQALDAYATQAGAFDPEDAILTPEFLRRFCQPHESFFESRPRGKHGS